LTNKYQTILHQGIRSGGSLFDFSSLDLTQTRPFVTIHSADGPENVDTICMNEKNSNKYQFPVLADSGGKSPSNCVNNYHLFRFFVDRILFL
jgi:hypothetical protein